MARLIIEGWRFLPHSYAIVNHQHLVRLHGIAGLELFHRDYAFPRPTWSEVKGVFDAEHEAAVRAIPSPREGERVDALLRMRVPYDLTPAPEADRTYVFMTGEQGRIPDSIMVGGMSLAQSAHEAQIAAAAQGKKVRIIVPSRWSRDAAVRSGAPVDMIDIVPHGVETSLFYPAEAQVREQAARERGWNDNVVVLHVGAMTSSKGPEILLRGFAHVARRVSKAILVLKGLDAMYSSGEFLAQFAELLTPAERQALEGRVVYIGDALSMAQQAELFRTSDVYACPYRGEGFNMPALEAVACGMPVVCTANGPTDDFVPAGVALKVESRTGANPWAPGDFALVPNQASFNNQLERAVANASVRAKAREVGPGFVANGWTWEQVVQTLVKTLGVG